MKRHFNHPVTRIYRKNAILIEERDILVTSLSSKPHIREKITHTEKTRFAEHRIIK